MVSAFLCKTLFPIKITTVDSVTPLPLIQHNHYNFPIKISAVDSTTPPLCILHNHSNNNHPVLRSVSSEISTNQYSFKITYLIDSCGLSPETAISVSEKVQFENPDGPDAVLNLLKNHGFSQTNISYLVKMRPAILLANPEKTLLPKLEFFQSIGVSSTILARSPTLLARSLENQIAPAYNFLKSVLHSNEKIVSALKRTSWILEEDHSKHLVPNIDLLREVGVPETCITLLLTHFPEALVQRHDQFIEIVNEVRDMGFDPLKSTFVLAVHAISGKGNKSTYNRCYEVYKRWGLSEDEILSAFRKHPSFMIVSEKKIMRAMDYFVNKMGWPPAMIARCPSVLSLSLDKRIIPRCSVIQVLSLRGLLVIKETKISSVLVSVEKYFLRRFVSKYLEEVPQLLAVYQGKKGVLEV